MRTRTRAEWLKLLETGVPSSPANDIGALVATAQVVASELVQQLSEGGPKVVGIPITFDRVRSPSVRPAPKLGEHTIEILGKEVGPRF